jgi:hypothetical protein
MPAGGNTKHGRGIDRAGWKTDQLPMESGSKYSTRLPDGNHPDWKNLRRTSLSERVRTCSAVEHLTDQKGFRGRPRCNGSLRFAIGRSGLLGQLHGCAPRGNENVTVDY